MCTPVFSRTAGVLSHLNFLTHRFPRFPPRNLVLPRHARCVLSRLRCNEHRLLLSSSLFRIGSIENPSCSARGHLSSHSALSSYELFAPLTLWQLSILLRPLAQTLESCQTSGAPWSPAMPPSLVRGRVTNNNRSCVASTTYSPLYPLRSYSLFPFLDSKTY